MRYLLDTCVLIWTLEGNHEKLGSLYEVITNSDCRIYVSVVSVWEILLKKSVGKLSTPDDLEHVISNLDFNVLNLNLQHVLYIQNLLSMHPDPFDRLLVAQSKVEGFTFLTKDQKILDYFRKS